MGGRVRGGFLHTTFCPWPQIHPEKEGNPLLLHFLFANAKLAIWKSRKNQLAGVGWTDAVLCLRGLVAARLRVENAYYTLINHLQGFLDVWAVGQVLCSLGDNDSLILFLKCVKEDVFQWVKRFQMICIW